MSNPGLIPESGAEPGPAQTGSTTDPFAGRESAPGSSQVLPLGPEEIPAAEVCRPQLFLRPEVAGLAEATTILGNDSPEGRWLFCLQWANGRREMTRLPQWLDLPSRSRLWLSPMPHPPRAGTVPGWSVAGRRRWLCGETPDTAALFYEMLESINRFVAFPDEAIPGAPATVALWAMLTYCYPV
jgi:hypothetical protein